MEKIRWCLDQRNGLELVEPNDNLGDAYLVKADEALETLRTSKIRDWQLTTAYYAIYHSIYSLLMRIGVKCEIHSCTIEFAKKFLGNYFSEGDFEMIDKAFSARIDSQYYVDRQVPDEKYDLIIRKTPLFLVKCRNVVILPEHMEKIRSQLRSFLQNEG
ncbi:hypothetical protein DRJ25_02960 [Candidatus Woesearchaeota archaeon]|nr:MAG: hypothetical protein DRJ25_02960 [Candidatus Woesearchaeota archaeon]